MNLRHRIFGKNVSIDLTGLPEAGVLEAELNLYPSVSEEITDLFISFAAELGRSCIKSTNPSTHQLLASGIGVVMGTSEVQFLFENGRLSRINFSFVKPKGNILLNTFQKLKSIQYLTDREAIGQIFHELILIPSVFFDPSRAIVHASGITTPKRQTVLFGGTGGVGKTSLELELCLHKSCHFVADDLCVINNRGEVFPNLAYPKVYGYNVKGNIPVKKAIFRQRNIVDKLQWHLLTTRGLNKVRRQISPKELYGNVISDGTGLDKFIILSRENVSKIQLVDLSASLAAKLNAKVIQSEYGVFLNHIYWHEYNSYLTNQEPYLTIEKILANLESNLAQALNNVEVYNLKIPISQDHSKFVYQALEVLQEELQLF